MDDDKLSALMKDVKAGVEAGEFATEAEGIKLLLRKKIYGVLPMEGEAENARIREIELMISRDQEVPAGMINSVAQHIYKIETNAYPEDVQVDLNRTKTFIKPKHIAGVKKDEDGEIIEIVLDPKQAPPRTYNVGQIYFEPQTGELFKNVSKQGEAPRFVKVIFE
jgi:5-hydroxyisourate hydrolase-like protein (transthyretin family)